MASKRLDAADVAALLTSHQEQMAELPSAGIEREQAGQQLRKAVLALPPRESEILTLRFGLAGDEPKSVDEIAKKFQRSPCRIHEVMNRGLSQLRRELWDEYAG